ncbi:MAG: NC domain-containing protein [Propionibacteriales bacterium]|nr:NC domain-containing protein [Propionibacteriales bacterium]
MGRGDHIYVRRRGYTHHGIDCGDGTVIHFTGIRGTGRYVGRTPIGDFAAGRPVKTRRYPQRLDADETVRNAESRMDSREYHLVTNNCEHFATWCCTGRSVSGQVRGIGVWTLHGAVTSALVMVTSTPHTAAVGTAGLGIYAVARRFRRR